jgi:hypothetical protein
MALGATSQHAHPYRRRDPELSDLHRFVRDHLEEFLLWTEEHFADGLVVSEEQHGGDGTLRCDGMSWETGLVLEARVLPSPLMSQVVPIPTAVVQHALVLDDGTRAKLTIQHRALNRSAKLDAMRDYLKAVWTGTPTLPDLQEMVEATWCSEYIENFAVNVPGADVDRLQGVLAVIEVMEG